MQEAQGEEGNTLYEHSSIVQSAQSEIERVPEKQVDQGIGATGATVPFRRHLRQRKLPERFKDYVLGSP